MRALGTLLALSLCACAGADAQDDAPRPDVTSADDGDGSELRDGVSTRTVPTGMSVVVVLELGAKTERTRADSIGVRHALDAFGIPYVVTSDLASALRAPEMIFVAGSANAPALARWAEQRGHTLWLAGTESKPLLAALGLETTLSSAAREALFVEATHPLATYADTVEEREVRLYAAGSHVSYRSTSPTWSFTPAARYADGGVGAVVVQNGPLGGRAVVLGSSFTDLLTRLEVGRGPQDGCTNAFHASLDTTRLFIRRGYELFTLQPSLRDLAPNGRKAAVILTHDMDASTAFVAWRDVFMPLERAQGVRSTLFVTTSYRDTHWIRGFYADPETPAVLAETRALGFDLQSHSVSHSPDFASFPMGVAALAPDDYRPLYSTTDLTTGGGAVLPELTVSRHLLETDFGASVRGFRAGYLAKPQALVQAEEEVGYAYDATSCAGEIGGAFPYLHLAEYATTARETSVLEVPLAISDNAITTRTQEATLAIWTDVTAKQAANGAPTVILVHPTNPEQKAWAYARWLTWVTAQPELWVGSMDAYYAWYQASGVSSRVAGYPY
jgi:Polysaccharide deacetylase